MRPPHSLQVFCKQLKSKRFGLKIKKTRHRWLFLERLEDRITPSTLDIYGDQIGLIYNDTISIDETASNGVSVNINGQVETFDPGTITAINVYPGLGDNTVNVFNTPVRISIQSITSDAVNLGNPLDGVQGITASVTTSNVLFNTQLTVDDSADSIGRTASINNNSVVGLAPATIFFDQLAVLGVAGGSGGNTFTITDTSSSGVFLEAGSGNDTVDVQATTGSLDVQNDAGNDTVRIGTEVTIQVYGLQIILPPTTSNIQGSVNVHGAGSTALFVDDSGDTTGRAVSMFDGEIDGLSPAPIFWSPSATGTGGVDFLKVSGGNGHVDAKTGNSFTVFDTSDLRYRTYLVSGSGTGGLTNLVTVSGTTGDLFVDGAASAQRVDIGLRSSMPYQTLAFINGYVDVYNSVSSGSTELTIFDRNDTDFRTAFLTDQELVGLSPAVIRWAPASSPTGGVNLLAIQGSGGGTNFNVFNTGLLVKGTHLFPSGPGSVNVQATTGPLLIYGVGGSQTVTIGSLSPGLGGTLSSINGPVNIVVPQLVQPSFVSLIVDDSGDTNGRWATLNDSNGFFQLNGMALAPISIENNVQGELIIHGGSGGNEFDVQNTASIPTFLFSGNGNDYVNVLRTSGSLDAVNNGGNDIVTIGNRAGYPLGLLDRINGSVNVHGAGTTALYVDDSGDGTPRNASLHDGGIYGLSPAPIFWTPSANPTGGVTYLKVLGGGGPNVFTVYDTSNILFGTYLVSGSGRNGPVLNEVDIQRTTGALYADGGAGNQNVIVGSMAPFRGTLDNINGTIDVYNSVSSGSSVLLVDDSQDTSFRTAILTDEELAGLSPALIRWTPTPFFSGGVTDLVIDGSRGGTTFYVLNTGDCRNGTFLIPIGSSQVNVQATIGPLFITGGSESTSTYSVNIGSLAPALGSTLANIYGLVDVGAFPGAASVSVTVDDSGDTIGRRATLEDTGSLRLTGMSFGTINLSDSLQGNLTIYGGSGGNTFNVWSTGSIPTTLSSGNGNDSVNVLATTGSLDVVNNGGNDIVTIGSLAPNFGGTLSNINGWVWAGAYGSTGTTTLSVDDSGDTASRTAMLFSGELDGMSPAPIYFNVASLTINAGSGANTYNVFGSDPTTSTSVILNAGSGSSDTVNVGSGGSTSTLDFIQAPLTINSQTGQTALNINEQGSLSGHSYILTSTTLSRSGAATITYDPVTSLKISAGSGNDSLVVVSTAPGTPITFNGGGGSNTVVGPDFPSTFNIASVNGGVLGNVSFASVQNLIGGLANDTFAFRTGSLAGGVNGGGGTNTLDYSHYLGNITVDMPLAKATGVGGNISRLRSVIGSIGNDLIVGDANANLLQGGTGRNIIIGGARGDRIVGGGGDNILIGGTTLWDANLTALKAIFQEWADTSLSFDSRVNALRQGIVVNGVTYALNKNTVHADSSPDNLIGGAGQNWFFVDFDDVIDNGAGPAPTDRLTRV